MMADYKKYFNINEEVKKNILKVYGRDLASLNDDVEATKKWLKSQPHLPEIADNQRIEKFLLLNKFSIERAKKKIDMYYTIRSLIPDVYNNPKLPHMQEMMDVVYWIPVPQLTEDYYRVLMCKCVDTDVNKFDPLYLFAHMCNVAEIRLEEDFVIGDIVVFDLEGAKIGHIKKFTPLLISKLHTITEKVFSNRIAGLHFINCPTFVNVLISTIKTVVKPKMAARIHVHKDLESLNEHFPKGLLPKDYGGDEMTLSELNESIKKSLTMYQARFDLLDTLKVDEDLRPYPLDNDDVLGYHGNFKKLNVD